MNKSTRILVVDDNPAIVQVFSEMLRTEGYEVWKASTGQRGLQVTREKRPDLVLLDVVLPDLSGIEVCRQIKADAALPDVFVVLISGEATGVAHKVDGLETGADDYITKTVDPKEFLARIRTIIRLRDTTAALRASEQHYRRLIEMLPDAVGLIDLQGRLAAVNQQAVAMLGYAKPAELLDKNAFDLMPPEYHERIRADMAATLKTGIMRNAEYTMLTKSGNRFLVELSAAVSTDADGQARGIVILARDLTARQQAEARIRELLHILDQARDAIVVRDLEGRIQYFNQGAERLLGWSADEVRGRRATDLFFGDTSEFDAAMEKLLQTGEWSGELQVWTKGRQPVIAHSRWTLVHGDADQSPYVVSINTDVTERKRAEAALQESEHRFRRLYETMIDPYASVDMSGKIIEFNDAFRNLIGYSDDEIRSLTYVDITPEKWHSVEAKIIEEQVLRRGYSDVYEKEYRRKDGALLPVELRTCLIRDDSNRPVEMWAILRDVIERKWTEKLLQVQRDFGIFLSSTNDLKAAAERLLEIALQSGGMDCGGVYLMNLETGALNLVAHRGLSAASIKRVSHFAADPVQMRPAKAGQAICWRQGEPMAGLAQRLQREGLLAVKAIPIRHGGLVVAVLNLGSYVRAEIPVKSCQMIEAIAAQAGGAIARIKAEQSLQANRQLLEKTFQSLIAAVFVVDAKTTTIQECNPAATRIFGYARDEMIGRTTPLLHLNKTMREKFRAHLHAAVKDKGFLREFEFKMRRKDGTSFPAEHSLRPIRNEAGRVVSWVAVVLDITERKRVEEELRHLSRRIIEVQEAERLRVARDLHDGVNQLIASAKMRLRKVEDGAAGLNPAAREILARCHELLVQALEESRRIAYNLRPSDLDELGLPPACRNFCQELESRTDLAVKCSIARLSRRLPPAVELNLFRIAQEALNNVEKHARAKTVRLRIARQGDAIVLRIQDDGRGFSLKASKSGKGKWRGTGLTNMCERAASLGGNCQVESVPKKGTVITVRVPCGKAK